MIQSYLENNLTPLTSTTDSVRLTTDCIRSCNCNRWLCHNQGSANYEIVEGGLYEIDFNTSATGTAAGTIGLQLYMNGEPIPGTLMAGTLAAANDYTNLGINKKIKVCCRGNATISVRSVAAVPNVTTPATPTDTIVPTLVSANLSIRRIA